jgi:hypothetical protein
MGRLPQKHQQEEEDAVHPEARLDGGVPDEDRQRPGDPPRHGPGERCFRYSVYSTV